MEDNGYKKSYKGLILWILGYAAVMMAAPFLPCEDEGLLVRLLLNLTAWAVVLLCYIVYRTQAVYWYNGTSFEAAKAAGSERRREFARLHLQRFAAGAEIYLVFSLISYGLHLASGIDIAVFVVLIAVSAFRTVGIKL